MHGGEKGSPRARRLMPGRRQGWAVSQQENAAMTCRAARMGRSLPVPPETAQREAGAAYRAVTRSSVNSPPAGRVVRASATFGGAGRGGSGGQGREDNFWEPPSPHSSLVSFPAQTWVHCSSLKPFTGLHCPRQRPSTACITTRPVLRP